MSMTLALVLAHTAVRGQGVVLQPGTILTKSCRVLKATYRFPMPEGEKQAGGETIPTLTPALVVKGDGITVDFAGATLLGSAETAQPNERKGLAVQVEGNNVTIKNLNVHGYKVGLIARNCKGLKVLDSDLSYNWKQHLASTTEKEDESDWQSYHHNENDEWLRYGAGIYLSGCEGFEVKGVKIVGGQCGLMLNRSNKGTVWNNNFSFLTGVGFGLYRSSDNRVMHNKIDWCVRGFSYGVYNRGQDSAGILIFEQCNRNVFAYNSVTHGGDGFFLWAGQDTMDTGKGGCNDNLLYGNDFSHAPTNGIEATFSRNNFIYNKVHECANGVWGGYSYDTKIIGNDFANNQVGIAIEHGQNNLVQSNMFNADDVAVSMWSSKSQDPNWGYPKGHDTVSHDPKINGNSFWHNPLAIDLRMTTNAGAEGNVFYSVAQPLRFSDDSSFRNPPALNGNLFRNGTKVPPQLVEMDPEQKKDGWFPMESIWSPLKSTPIHQEPNGTTSYAGELAYHQVNEAVLAFKPAPMKGGQDPFLKAGALRGWKYMLVDDWGPYDFKRPLLWPERLPLRGEAPKPGANAAASSGTKPKAAGKPISDTRYEILGPKGRWRILSSEGVTPSKTSGTVPGFVDLVVEKGRVGKTSVQLEYVGAATTDYRGVVTPAGKPVRFGFSKFFAPIDWNVKFYKWSESEDPSNVHSNPKDFEAVKQTTPIKELTTDRVDFAGYALVRGLPNDHYATVADGSFSVPEGDYVVELTTDDGAKLTLDGTPLITDAWKYQGPTQYTKNVHLTAGKHTMHLEHFQIDGYATLKVNIRPRG